MSDSNLRGTADLSQIRSKSYEHPKTDSELAPATGAKSPVHFAPDVAEHLRPNYNANSRGYSTGNVNTGTPRPKINNRTTSFAIPERPKISSRTTSFAKAVAKRQTMARTLSSASLYSNFAGERYGESRSHSRSTSRAGSLYKDEKRKSMGSNKTEDIKHEESTLGDEMVEDVEEGEAKASVGKAMFMFLKAFIGTGVLFLPKA
jgi:hypothetical protein